MRRLLRSIGLMLGAILAAFTIFLTAFAPRPALSEMFRSPGSASASLVLGCAIDALVGRPVSVMCYGATGNGVNKRVANNY